MKTDLGYDPHQTMSVPIPIHEGTYETWKERSEYFEQIRARIAAMPQVVAAGISTNATPPANGSDSRIEMMGSGAAEKPVVRVNFISPEYFPVLRIPLAQGRVWDQAETRRGAPLAVINQAMARQYWPKGDAIGHQFRIPGMKNEPPYQPAAAGSEGWIADRRRSGGRAQRRPAQSDQAGCLRAVLRCACGCSRRSWCARAYLRFRCCATYGRNWCRSTGNSR